MPGRRRLQHFIPAREHYPRHPSRESFVPFPAYDVTQKMRRKDEGKWKLRDGERERRQRNVGYPPTPPKRDSVFVLVLTWSHFRGCFCIALPANPTRTRPWQNRSGAHGRVHKNRPNSTSKNKKKKCGRKPPTEKWALRGGTSIRYRSCFVRNSFENLLSSP